LLGRREAMERGNVDATVSPIGAVSFAKPY
jgi:hypothetical protein